MKKILLCLIFLFSLGSGYAQKVYFIYLQSESGQPFFVKMNEKILSSSSSGYIILSRLLDSSYSFSVGFPQNKWPEQKFSVDVDKKDHGFLLKNFGENEWGIFDLQTLSVQKATIEDAKAAASVKTENKDVSAFTDILSKASDDPSLREKPVEQKIEEKKPEVIVQEIPKKEEQAETKIVQVIEPVAPKKEETKDSVQNIPEKNDQIPEKPVVKNENPVLEIKADTISKVEERILIENEDYKKSIVTKRSESSTTEGFGLVFIDEYANGIKDTIRLLIPNSKPVVQVNKEEPKEDKKFLDISAAPQVKKDEKIEEPKPVSNEMTPIKPEAKNNCNDLASESDFFTLRKIMAAAQSDDDMIGEAKKYSKMKCFATSQIKNLGALFLNDEGKYKFFDAIYNYTSDAENFSLLQSELKDEYYINRFKAMLRK